MKLRLIAPLVAALGFSAVPALSATVEYVEVQSPPPALQVETTPAPMTGKVWIPGSYEYKDGQYVWMKGHFVPERKGYVYVAPRYEDGKYYMGRYGSEEHGGTRNKIHTAKDKVREKVGLGKDKD